MAFYDVSGVLLDFLNVQCLVAVIDNKPFDMSIETDSEVLANCMVAFYEYNETKGIPPPSHAVFFFNTPIQ